jgi:chromosomal replication initiation ATPase DnaA
MAEQLVFDLPQRAAMGREAFLIADSNREAVALIDGFAQWQNPVQWIYGPRSAGKSHLAAVLAHQCRALTVQAADLGGADIEAVLAGDAAYEAVIVDGLEGVAKADEEVLFHLLNFARHMDLKILLLSVQGAGGLQVALPDLASRLKAIAGIALKSPDDTLMRGLLVKLFGDRQLRLEARVIDYLLPRMERDYATMAALVARIDRQALAEKRSITVPMVAEILESHISETE